jgi:uncharacterized protein involved in type VI secretion and phage assembly
MATLNGVYSASVVDNRDPDGLGRVLIRVSVPTDVISSDLWARLATTMAGRNRGTWFIPDVGDEVLVAFERGDVKEAYVIGALWNSKARPPTESPGDVKLIRSRNGVTLRISDDRNNNALILETPAGQRITLQDNPGSVRVEDANGNSVLLSRAGMTVNASAAVTVNASRVEVSAGLLTVNASMSRFSGVVQCDTMISNSVISASYSPGAGNIW